MRSKYIRFFVSSTFDDMKLERDLMQEIFTEIEAEYSQQNWQIEMIDLRWGISKEAGLDNKTMQICKEELSRCQQLSPKPNFIILLGDRYGWIPLPEVIPIDEYKSLRMNLSERLLFCSWYRLDENILPNGAYILKSRYSEKGIYVADFTKDDIWKEEVVKPLSAMYERNHCTLYGTSATEQEIELGALNVENAQEHVIAYIRHMRNIPEEKKKTYVESDKEKEIKDLETKVRNKLSKDNIVSLYPDFAEYKTDAYKSAFKSKMLQHIRSIINKVIEERNQVAELTENQIHIEYAIKEASQFIGREKELDFIDNYLHDTTTNFGLWFQAPSGMGKSALLAKVVSKYQDEFDVICRFCGTTEKSINARSLYSSLHKDIWTINLQNNGKIYKEINYEWIESYRLDYCNYFTSLFSKLSLKKPLLIIIDSLDRVDDSGLIEFNNLQWLNIPNGAIIKTIISSTNEVKYRIELPFLKKIQLDNMGDDAMSLMMYQVSLSERTLTDKQIQQLSTVLNKSCKSPLYIKLLGRIISQSHSWQDFSEIPYDLIDLVGFYCLKLGSPSRHGLKLIKHITCRLAVIRMGMTEKEILEIMEQDKEYIKELCFNSPHVLVSTKVPPIIWIRLRHDLQPLLRLEYTSAGHLLAFFHTELKQIVLAMFRNIPNEVNVRFLELYRYYVSKYPERHALLEGPRCLYNAFRHEQISQDEYLQHMERNLEYIVYKKIFYPSELYEDYNRAISAMTNPSDKEWLNQIKIQLQNIRNHMSPRDVRMALRNMPITSPLRLAMECGEDCQFYMEDKLAYTPIQASLYILNNVGFCPCMSQDGKIVASLIENGLGLKIEYLHKNKTVNYSFTVPALEIQVDDNVNIIAVRFKDLCQLIDNESKQVIYNTKIGSRGWMSLSADGCKFIIGDETLDATLYNKTNNHKYIWHNILHARLSPSGNFIWLITPKDIRLWRYDFLKESFIPFHVLWDEKTYYPEGFTSSDVRIVSCSEECCIAGNFFIQHHVNEQGGDAYVRCDLPIAPHLPVQNPAEFVHRSLPIWIEPTGVCRWLYNNNKEVILGTIRLKDLQYINGDFSIALSANKGRVFDFREELKTFKCVERDSMIYNTGFNFSVSNDGNQVAVSSYGGHGYSGSVQILMLRASNGLCYAWSPFSENDRFYMSLPANAISPDGSLMAVSVYTDGRIVLCGTFDNHIIWQYKLPLNDDRTLDNAMRISFSADGRYLALITGDNISPSAALDLNIFVFNVNGEKIRAVYNKIDLDDEDYIEADYVTFTPNNRFLLAGNRLYDLIEERCLSKEESLYQHFYVISPSTPDIYDGINHINLYTKEVGEIDDNYPVRAVSPSGKYHYSIINNSLFVREWLVNGKQKHLRNDVVEIYPALDDRYVYLLDTHAHFILYDTQFCKDIQIATKGMVPRSILLGIKVCAQGLAVFNSDTSELSLFSPDEKYNVNKPAITTFVRRWRLEDKTLQVPTAICPMCGKSMDYKDFSFCQLKEYNPNEVHSADWDWPRLRNHHCPHCDAELHFNPYIL